MSVLTPVFEGLYFGNGYVLRASTPAEVAKVRGFKALTALRFADPTQKHPSQSPKRVSTVPGAAEITGG